MKRNRDAQLLEGLRRQDPQALERAIGQYGGYVAAVVGKVLGRLGTQEDVEELSSDVFVALWQSAIRLREDSSLRLWLGVVARNRALKHLRSLKLEEPLDLEILPTGDVPGQWEDQERAQAVRHALLTLSSEDREIFLRHYFWGQGVGQIAGEMAMNPSTVKSRLKRGRDKLRTVLEKEDAI